MKCKICDRELNIDHTYDKGVLYEKCKCGANSIVAWGEEAGFTYVVNCDWMMSYSGSDKRTTFYRISRVRSRVITHEVREVHEFDGFLSPERFLQLLAML